MNCYLFGKLIFKSYINESLDFEETRVLKILQVLNNIVEIEIEEPEETEEVAKGDSETSFLKPMSSRRSKSRSSKSSRVFKLKFEDFENLLKTNSELCVIDDSISKIFLKDLSMFNPKFSYSHIKTFKNAF